MGNSFQDDINKYADLWDKARETDDFKAAPKPPEPDRDVDFFGQYPSVDDVPLNECDTKYWQMVYRMSNHSGQAPDPTIKEEKAEKNPNPIMPWTKGIDQDMKVTPNWSDGKELVELANLKLNLQKLEDKLNTDMGLGKGDAVQGKINSLKKQIDDLSNSLYQGDDSE